MNRVIQAILYVAFAAFIGYLSVAPAYQYAAPELAVIKLSLSHAADRVEDAFQVVVRLDDNRAGVGIDGS